jgi:hypothetical protein
VAILAAASAAAGSLAFAAGAATKTYTGNTGLWSAAGNWTPSGVPGSNDAAVLLPNFSPGVTVTYDGTVLAANTAITSLTINSTNASTISLFQSANLLFITNSEIVGDTGTGALLLAGGTHTVGNGLTIANGATSSGSLTMGGGTLNAFEIDPGLGGTGILSQTAGLINAQVISVGRNSAGNGLYTLSGGTAIITSLLYVGESGSGTVNQSGGSVSLTGLGNTLQLGASSSTAKGTYNLSNGASLSAAGGAVIGNVGQGTFNQTGGQSAFGQTVTIGFNGTVTLIGGTMTAGAFSLGTSGHFNLGPSAVDGTLNYTIFNQSGGTFAASGNEFLGATFGATYTQTGGTHTVVNTLFIAAANTATGTYSLGSGLLSASEVDAGYAGTGTLSQTGGALNASFVSVGRAPGSRGLYALSGGMVTVSNVVLVGESGNGILNQSAGTASFVGLHLGENGGATGAYNLSNGASLSVIAPALIGNGGQGTFTQTGGQATFSIGLTLGASLGGAGTVSLLGGTLSAGNGTITLNSGSRFNLGPVAVGSLAFNSFIQTGGEFLASGDEAVGFTNRATYTQIGGVHTAAANLLLAANPASGGTYALGNGLLLANNIFIGGSSISSGGTGRLIASTGAIVTVTNNIKVWNAASALVISGGTVNLTGLDLGGVPSRLQFTSGTLHVTGGGGFSIDPASAFGPSLTLGANQTLNVDFNEFVGSTGAGTLSITGGSNHISNPGATTPAGLLLGFQSGASGSGSLSAGNLSVDYEEYVGYDGTATFTQSGGTNSARFLTLGWNTGAGTYTLSGGVLSTTNGSTFVGYTAGDGAFNHTGGTHSAGHLYVGYFAAASGTYAMSNAAVLNVTTDEQIGAFGAGTFNQTGGTHTLGGSMYLGVYAGGGGTLNLSGGNLLMPAGTLYAGFGGNGVFNLTDGRAVVGNVMLGASGGGAGTVSLSNSLGNPMLVASTITVPAGSSFNILVGHTNVLSYTNFAQVGGSVVTSGDEFCGAVNAATYVQSGGVHTVAGTLFLGDPFSSSGGGGGTYTLQSGELSAGGIQVNPGSTFNFQGGSLVVAQTIQTATNSTFRGQGLVNPATSLNNAGTLMADWGNLTVIAPSFVNVGTLANAGGASLFIVGTNVTHTGNILANSLGVVSLDVPITNGAGRSITLAGGGVIAPLITNSIFGTVSGFGQINGRFVNNGTSVTFTGPTQIVGSVTNAATALMTVRNSQLLITGPTVNNGTIRAIVGGSVAFDGGLTGNAVAGAGATPAAVSYAGAVSLDPGSALSTPYLQQDSLTLHGNPGVPSSYSSASIRLRRDGGSDGTLRLLSIQTSGGNALGSLDLADTRLTVDGTATPPATVKSYIASAYTGNQDWGGAGLTSSLARGNPVKYSVAYASGSDQSAQDAGIPVDPGKVLAKAVLTGDANMDGHVDFFDVAQVLGYRYNAGGNNAAYTDGDLDYSGSVDFFDIVTLLSANYNSGETLASAAASGLGRAAPSLTSASEKMPFGPSLIYNPATGHLEFRTNGGTFTTTGGQPSFVCSLVLLSKSGILIPAGASSTFAGGTGATLTTTMLASALTNSPGFTDGFDIGAVLPPGLGGYPFVSGVSGFYQVLDGGGLRPLPDPAGSWLLGSGSLLLARRRRRRRGC